MLILVQPSRLCSACASEIYRSLLALSGRLNGEIERKNSKVIVTQTVTIFSRKKRTLPLFSPERARCFRKTITISPRLFDGTM